MEEFRRKFAYGQTWFFETCLGCFTNDLVCPPEFGSDPSTNMGAVRHFGFFSLSHFLRNQWKNFVKTTHMTSSLLDASPRKQFQAVSSYGRQTAILEIATSPLLNILSVSHPTLPYPTLPYPTLPYLPHPTPPTPPHPTRAFSISANPNTFLISQPIFLLEIL